MPSKKKIQKPKNPKKVAAGEARAKKALRINGRFTSNEFYQDVKQQAEQAGVKDVFSFFNQHEKEFSDLYSTWMQASEYFDYAFLNIVKEYSSTIFVNERQNTNGTALQKLLSFNQYLKNNHNVVAWSIMSYIRIAGGLKFTLPSDVDMDKYSDLESLEDYLASEHNIKIIVSEKKAGPSTRLASRKGRFKKVENVGKNKTTKAAPKRKKR